MSELKNWAERGGFTSRQTLERLAKLDDCKMGKHMWASWAVCAMGLIRECIYCHTTEIKKDEK